MHEFTKSITVEVAPGVNRAFDVGQQIEQSEVMPGCFESLTRQKILVEVAVEVQPVKAADPIDDDAKAKRKK